MLKLFLLTSIFVSRFGAEGVTNTMPPFRSNFFSFWNKCGIANLCEKPTDVGCFNHGRINKEADFKGGDYVKDGIEMPRFHYPWMAVLIFEEKDGGPAYCTATLISARHVLTARHCFWGVGGITNKTYGVSEKTSKDTIWAFLGPGRVGSEPNNFTYHRKREVTEIKIPPNTFSDHDLALARMRDVEFSFYIRPICLPFDGIPISGHYSFAGWGATEGQHPFGDPPIYPDQLQEINGLHVKTLHQDWPLDEPFHQLDPSTKWAHNGTNVTSFFYLNITDNGTPCIGDSGGALMWHDPITDRYFMMGVFSLAFNDISTKKGIDICATFNNQKWRASIFTKVTYYLDYIYQEMKPDAFANGMCRASECHQPNATFAKVDKYETLYAPCGSVEGIGTFCLTGDSLNVLDHRNVNYTTKKEYLTSNGFAECKKCTNKKPDWNYQQWIDEITLGSFTRERYIGSESPYSAFAQSYFQGVWDDEDLNKNETDSFGELTCPFVKENVLIPASVVCDGFKDCPNAWDENPFMCAGNCSYFLQHEQTQKVWKGGLNLTGEVVDIKTCYDICHNAENCMAYEWTADNAGCRLFNQSAPLLKEVPGSSTVIRGPSRCPELREPGKCSHLVGHQNRNGAFRIQDFRGKFMRVFPLNAQKVEVDAMFYSHLMLNGSLDPESEGEFQGNMHEWIFKHHGHRLLRDSYVTIMSGIVHSKGPFTEPKYLTFEYKFNGTHDVANVLMKPKLWHFHDDKNKLDQRFYLKPVYDITRDPDDLMYTAIYSKYYDANEDANVTVRLFSSVLSYSDDRKQHGSKKLKGKKQWLEFLVTASGPKSHSPAAPEGKFRFLECDELLPHLKRVYETPPQRADKVYEVCKKFEDDYTEMELHFGFGISMSHIRRLTIKQRKNLVEKICKSLADSDHIWDYAGKMRLHDHSFRKMYQTIEKLKADDKQDYVPVLMKLKPYFLQKIK